MASTDINHGATPGDRVTLAPLEKQRQKQLMTFALATYVKNELKFKTWEREREARAAQIQKCVWAACQVAAAVYFSQEGKVTRLGDTPQQQLRAWFKAWPGVIKRDWPIATLLDTVGANARHVARSGAGLPALYNHQILSLIPSSIAELEALLGAEDVLLKLAQMVLNVWAFWVQPMQLINAPGNLKRAVVALPEARGLLPFLVAALSTCLQLLLLYHNPIVRSIRTAVTDHTNHTNADDTAGLMTSAPV